MVGIRLQVYLLRIKVFSNNAWRSFICTSSHFWQPPSPPRVRKLDNFFAFEVESSGRAREQLVTRTILQRWPRKGFRGFFGITQPFPRHPSPLRGRNGERGERQLPCSPSLLLVSPLCPAARGRECVAWQKEGQQPTLNSPRTSPARPPACPAHASIPWPLKSLVSTPSCSCTSSSSVSQGG